MRGARTASAAASTTRLVRLVDQPGEAARDVDVGGGEDAGVVELEQQPGGAAGEADVEAVALVNRGHAHSPGSA